MNILVVGGGRISLSHIPQILAIEEVQNVHIIEPELKNRLVLNHLFNCKTLSSIKKINNFNEYDAAFVLTPTQHHYELCDYLINNKVNVFVEKPFTLNKEKSNDLIKRAKENNLSLHVGYVMPFNPLIRHFKKLISKKIDESSKFNFEISMYGNVVSSESKGWRFRGPNSGCLKDYGSHILCLSDYLFGPLGIKEVIESGAKFSNSSLDFFRCELVPDKYNYSKIDLKVDWARSEFRKATTIFKYTSSDEEISYNGSSIVIKNDQESTILPSDINTDCSFYLRGEEFSDQLDYFLKDLKSNKKDYENAYRAARTDEYLLEIEKST